jgi:hypothetical protein
MQRNNAVPSASIVHPVVDPDVKLAKGSPFAPIQAHLKRIAECRAQLAAIGERARKAVDEQRKAEGQLLQQATSETVDPEREAELIAARDAARAAVDPELHHTRVKAAESRIQFAIQAHDDYITEHLNELLAALAPELDAAEKDLAEAEEAIAPIRQRTNDLHDRERELEQYRVGPYVPWDTNLQAMVG